MLGCRARFASWQPISAGRGKGSHGWWEHPTGVRVNLAGQSGAHAHDHQEKQVQEAIREAKRREARQP